MSIYSLKLHNTTSVGGYAFLFKEPYASYQKTVVLESEYLGPSSGTTFELNPKFSFFLGYPGILEPGINVGMAELVSGEPLGRNLINLSMVDGSAKFENLRESSYGSSMNIQQGKDIPPGKYAVGIGFGGKPALLVTARAGENEMFVIYDQPRFRLSFADNEIETGQVIDPRDYRSTSIILGRFQVIKLRLTSAGWVSG